MDEDIDPAGAEPETPICFLLMVSGRNKVIQQMWKFNLFIALVRRLAFGSVDEIPNGPKKSFLS
jgi:hypothetical protein